MTGDKVEFNTPDEQAAAADVDTKPARKPAPKTEKGKGEDKYKPYVW